MGRRGYSPDIRRRALDQVAAGRSVYQVARDLGVSVQAIYSWRKKSAEAAAEQPDGSRPGAPASAGER